MHTYRQHTNIMNMEIGIPWDTAVQLIICPSFSSLWFFQILPGHISFPILPGHIICPSFSSLHVFQYRYYPTNIWSIQALGREVWANIWNCLLVHGARKFIIISCCLLNYRNTTFIICLFWSLESLHMLINSKLVNYGIVCSLCYEMIWTHLVILLIAKTGKNSLVHIILCGCMYKIFMISFKL